MDFVCVNRSSKPGEQEDHRRTDNNKDDHDKKQSIKNSVRSTRPTSRLAAARRTTAFYTGESPG